MPPRYYYKMKTNEGKIIYKALFVWLGKDYTYGDYRVIEQITAKEYYSKGGR